MAKTNGIKWNMRGIKKLRRMLGGDQYLAKAMTAAGRLYLEFTHKRFRRYSRGGGDWKGLADSTIRQRRKEGKGAAILVDTALLVSAIQPGASGSQLRMISPTVVRAGYSETTKHPGTNMTFAKLARIHQRGNNNLPARKIFVMPDEPTKKRMMSVVGKAIEKRGKV